MANFNYSLGGFNIPKENTVNPTFKHSDGFKAGYQLPAPHYNWIVDQTSRSIAELQDCFKNMVGGKFEKGNFIPIESGGTGATNDKDARNKLKVNLKTYISLDQIGITRGTETIEEIVSKLPDKSELICNINELANQSIYPSEYGVLKVLKCDESRTLFNFYQKGKNVHYLGTYTSTNINDDKPAWSGWSVEYNEARKPTPAEIGAVATKTTLETGTDLNTVTTSGIYRLGLSSVNAPSGSGQSYAQLLVIHGGGDTIAQIFLPYKSSSMYVRSGHPADVGGKGQWNDWVKVAADDHTHTPADIGAVNKNGDTINGNLEVTGQLNGVGGTFSGQVNANTFSAGGVNANQITADSISAGTHYVYRDNAYYQVISEYDKVYKTYTGSGSATNRNIVVGQGGKVLFLWSANTGFKGFFTSEGGILYGNDGNIQSYANDIGNVRAWYDTTHGAFKMEFYNTYLISQAAGTPFDCINRNGSTFEIQVI